MNNLIEYLKGPELVVNFQKFFGIKYVTSKNENNRSDDNSRVNHSKDNGKIAAGNGYVRKNQKEKASDSEVDSSSSSTSCSESESRHISSQEPKNEKPSYIVGNKFWYYLFIIGTELGDELFYASFIPFWFWNIDGAVGRRVIFVWAVVMYIGQGLKDIIRWARPGPPVARLQSKWGIEYGMPSTHAMVAVSIPFAGLIFTQQRYLYSFWIGLVITVIWCSVVCLSRIYLGMHSVLDVIVGIILTVLLMFILIPLVDFLDIYIVTNIYAPIFIFGISILLIYFYPKSDKWTPTRGDTAMTLGVCIGLQFGAWVNYHLGYLVSTDLPPPYVIIWPNYQMFGLLLVRTILGLCGILATRAISKSISYAFVCALLGRDKSELQKSDNSLENKPKVIVDLCYKYFTCGMIGFSTQFLLPNAFKLLGIGRPDFYTEI